MFRLLKILFYQLLANALTRKIKRTKDIKKLNRLYKTAMDFNKYCVSNNIYLK